MMTDLYILDEDNVAVPMSEESFMEWGRWMEAARESGRICVGDDSIEAFRVQTVFGGCNSNWDPGPPQLYESRVSEGGEKRDLYLRRYTTWAEAVAGHKALCAQIEGELAEK